MRDRSFNAELLDRALGRQLLGHHAHRRHAGAGPAPARSEERPVHSAASSRSRTCSKSRCGPRGRSRCSPGRRRTFGNLEARMKGTGGLKTLSEWIAQQFDPTVTWKDLAWLRERWPRKIIIKGILDAEDARLAVRARRRRDGGVQPRRPSARWRALDDLRAAGSRRCRRRPLRSVVRRRRALGPGRAQGAGARRQGLPDRQGVSLRARRARRSGRHARARHHPQGTRRQPRAHRRQRRAQSHARHPAWHAPGKRQTAAATAARRRSQLTRGGLALRTIR